MTSFPGCHEKTVLPDQKQFREDPISCSPQEQNSMEKHLECSSCFQEETEMCGYCKEKVVFEQLGRDVHSRFPVGEDKLDPMILGTYVQTSCLMHSLKYVRTYV